MNARQREVMRKNLRDEKVVIKELRKNYSNALADVERNLQTLMADELTQSKIYQIGYQKQLKAQIEGIVTTLGAGNLETVEKYLETCYTNGFVGAMYDLHGQGLPLVLPIDQAAVAQIISTTNGGIKLSERLWGTATALKNKIRSEIGRGISTGDSYANIARNLRNVAQIDMNKASRIARTEGHRVVETSAYNAASLAQEAGADVVKEWSSALDARTRPAHVALNGQLRELDEPFEIEGVSALYPSGFGRASMDIHCRCHVLQRASWALSDEELERLGRPIDAKTFDEFADKYEKAKPTSNIPITDIKSAQTEFERRGFAFNKTNLRDIPEDVLVLQSNRFLELVDSLPQSFADDLARFNFEFTAKKSNNGLAWVSSMIGRGSSNSARQITLTLEKGFYNRGVEGMITHLKPSIEQKWLMHGTATSSLDHEFGHIIDAVLRYRFDEASPHIYDALHAEALTMRTNKGARNKVRSFMKDRSKSILAAVVDKAKAIDPAFSARGAMSTYGNTEVCEWIAEASSEYYSGSNSTLAKAFGEWLKEAI